MVLGLCLAINPHRFDTDTLKQQKKKKSEVFINIKIPPNISRPSYLESLHGSHFNHHTVLASERLRIDILQNSL